MLAAEIDGVSIDNHVVLCLNGPRTGEPKIVIRGGTYINRFTLIDALLKVDIGRNCLIGPHCYIGDHDRAVTRECPPPEAPLRGEPIIIGDGAWIGAGVVITRGVTIGKGAIIGAGIFVMVGLGAHYAGPGLSLSFVLSGLGCAFAGLCYAEFAAMIPLAGSAYTYAYATLGELLAWIIGWDLTLEYAMGASTVSSGWSNHFIELLDIFHIRMPLWLAYDHWTGLAQAEKLVK